MMANGEVNVSGPLDNKIFCYGLLEVARDLVTNYKPSAIIKPNIVVDINNNGKEN